MRENKLSDPIFEELSGGLNVTLTGPGKAFEKVIEDQKKAIEYVKWGRKQIVLESARKQGLRGD